MKNEDIIEWLRSEGQKAKLKKLQNDPQVVKTTAESLGITYDEKS